MQLIRTDDPGRRLLWHGMLLFLLGLATGLISEKLTNPRMGLSAHLEGLMNGTFLVAVGAAWSQVRLTERMQRTTFWIALFGTYVNWATTLLAAILGTSSLTPLAAAGRRAAAWQEGLVSIGFVSVALTMIVTAALLLYGFRGEPGTRRAPEQ